MAELCRVWSFSVMSEDERASPDLSIGDLGTECYQRVPRVVWHLSSPK